MEIFPTVVVVVVIGEDLDYFGNGWKVSTFPEILTNIKWESAILLDRYSNSNNLHRNSVDVSSFINGNFTIVGYSLDVYILACCFQNAINFPNFPFMYNFPCP